MFRTQRDQTEPEGKLRKNENYFFVLVPCFKLISSFVLSRSFFHLFPFALSFFSAHVATPRYTKLIIFIVWYPLPSLICSNVAFQLLAKVLQHTNIYFLSYSPSRADTFSEFLFLVPASGNRWFMARRSVKQSLWSRKG